MVDITLTSGRTERPALGCGLAEIGGYRSCSAQAAADTRGWWAAPLLVAAALITAIFYVLRIVQGQPADPSAAGRDETTQTM